MMAGTEGTLCSGRALRGCEHPPAPGISAVSLPLEPGVGHPGMLELSTSRQPWAATHRGQLSLPHILALHGPGALREGKVIKY